MAMMQLSLLDALRAPPVVRYISPDGPVVQGDPDEALCLPHPRMAWDRARVELHRHTDGLWMWSASWHANGSGSGYKVGPKWGRFAETRDDALHYAVGEIEIRIGTPDHPDEAAILTWARGLQ